MDEFILSTENAHCHIDENTGYKIHFLSVSEELYYTNCNLKKTINSFLLWNRYQLSFLVTNIYNTLFYHSVYNVRVCALCISTSSP